MPSPLRLLTLALQATLSLSSHLLLQNKFRSKTKWSFMGTAPLISYLYLFKKCLPLSSDLPSQFSTFTLLFFIIFILVISMTSLRVSCIYTHASSGVIKTTQLVIDYLVFLYLCKQIHLAYMKHLCHPYISRSLWAGNIEGMMKDKSNGNRLGYVGPYSSIHMRATCLSFCLHLQKIHVDLSV